MFSLFLPSWSPAQVSKRPFLKYQIFVGCSLLPFTLFLKFLELQVKVFWTSNQIVSWKFRSRRGLPGLCYHHERAHTRKTISEQQAFWARAQQASCLTLSKQDAPVAPPLLPLPFRQIRLNWEQRALSSRWTRLRFTTTLVKICSIVYVVYEDCVYLISLWFEIVSYYALTGGIRK